ncbi:MAG: N-acetylmuramoyl-L-alanine amidase [Acidobacteriaceae bacterium]|nr:N-acetylmuramoyl-L-alanine amidase [Acidobacteriaceae bacterium]
MREALAGKADRLRTKREYNRVIDAYRKVYYTAPNSSKADASALAVGELMVEFGRAFNDEKSFRDAIGQYEFLRREYPGSKRRVEALFTEGEIYREDLNDAKQAKQIFEEFLKRYPRSELADQARDAINEMAAEAKGGKPAAKKSAKKKPEPESKDTKREKSAKSRKADAVPNDEDDAASASGPLQQVSNSGARRGKLPLVTNIRHWSTPDYTRIAIDLEDEVKYEAGRVPSPDRIFFDLHDTKLASELVGKTFEVGDGFLRKIRIAQFSSDLTRVVLEVDDVAEYSAFLLPNPYRLIIDIHGKQQPQAKTILAKSATAEPPPAKPTETAKLTPPVIETAKPTKGRETKPAETPVKVDPAKTDTAKDLAKSVPALTKTEESALDNKDINNKEVKATDKPTSSPTFESVAPRKEAKRSKSKTNKDKDAELASSMRTAEPTASGERSLIRALGLKIGKIVVDAGHGGHDTGTIGPKGLMEKDLVLDVALRLGKLLESKLGAEVVYTRDDDTFIPLETRTAIANKAQADLFISVHANSSRDATARGVETYYLNFTSNADALEVAARENAVSQKSVFELQDLVKKIALKEKIEESREFATDVQKALHAGLTTKNSNMRDRGVKKAPFVVLIGANMPSILAEISFVSNPGDEKRLQTPEHRQKIAESLFKGVSRYADGLSGVKVAGKSESGSGQ